MGARRTDAAPPDLSSSSVGAGPRLRRRHVGLRLARVVGRRPGAGTGNGTRGGYRARSVHGCLARSRAQRISRAPIRNLGSHCARSGASRCGRRGAGGRYGRCLDPPRNSGVGAQVPRTAAPPSHARAALSRAGLGAGRRPARITPGRDRSHHIGGCRVPLWTRSSGSLRADQTVVRGR